jgi:signal transduction histidine kinase
MTHPSLPSDDSDASIAHPSSDVRGIGLRRNPVTNPERLAAVRATGLLDSDVEEVFDRLTKLAVRLLRIPAAFISLVGADRDFYKSTCGFGEPLASARELNGPTFCHYTIQRPTPLVIPDTAADPVYRNVPTVRSLGVAAYVGVPLIVGGQAIGAFCAIDLKPRAWTADEVEVLVELAASANREIDLRGAIATSRAAYAAVEAHARQLREANDQLREQAAKLEAQAEELASQAEALQATSAQLEERTEMAEAARASAEHANASKAQFLANMSHELRTPLNAIGGYTELIEMGINGPVSPEQLIALDRIRRSQRHLLGLINGVLNYAKVDAGAVHYDVQDVDIDEILETCQALVAPQVRAKNMHFRYSGDVRGLKASADAEKTQQVVLNLLSNALKFTDPGGRITMESAADSTTGIIVRVSDTGHGIAAGQLERVFEPFVQVDADLTRTHQGTGLGLAISRDLARGMGGDVTAESTLGVGSTFTLTLRRAS